LEKDYEVDQAHEPERHKDIDKSCSWCLVKGNPKEGVLVIRNFILFLILMMK
jgi:hypothetical protein